MTLAIAHEDRAPIHAVGKALSEAFRARVDELLQHAGTHESWSRCGHVDPRNPKLVELLSHGIEYALWLLLESTSDRAVHLRQDMRAALELTGPFDEVAHELHALGVALRRRQIYFALRRAAAVLERAGDPDGAALFAEAALRHEPAGDHLQFSARHRLKSERL